MLALQVNLVKLLVLAAAVPAATVGIAQRATEFAGHDGEATVVGVTGALGSLAAIIGAYALGRSADSWGASARSRWLVVLTAALISTAGTAWMAALGSIWELIASWVLVQFGTAGASAVLRTLLTHALPTQRRRGATAMIIFTYIGAGLPMVVLFLLPGQVWGSAVVFALLSVAAAAVALLRHRPDDHAEAAAQDTVTTPTANVQQIRVPWALLLCTQLGFHLVMASYLGYHALDIAARFSPAEGAQWEDATVRLSMLTLIAALLGLLASASFLLIRPTTMIRALPLLATSGALFTVTFSIRGLTDAVPVLILVVMLSGVAVGLNSTLLLAAALESGPKSTAGKRVGIYSAVTAVGQMLGPLLGLAIIRLFGEYQYLYLAISAIPLIWTAWALAAHYSARSRNGGS